MLGWSFSIGRIFGVEVRLHSFFLLLLVLSVAWSSVLGLIFARGVALWLLLLLAVAVREVARALAAAWFALDLRSLLLLPTGGIPTFSTPDSVTRASSPRLQKRMALVGPLASFSFGLLLIAIILSVAPTVELFQLKWVTPTHLLRTMVWVNLLLGAVNLLPAWPLDAGRLVRSEIAVRREDKRSPRQVNLNPASGEPSDAHEASTSAIGEPSSSFGNNRSALTNSLLLQSASSSATLRVLSTLGPAIALILIVLGFISVNWWLIMAGVGTLLGAQIERRGMHFRSDLDHVLVRDIMLTDYSVLSASATLEDALEHARHSLQDVFPVVRGGSVVGAIARHTILANIEATGNSYVQGIMTRTFPTTTAAEPLLHALARITGSGSETAQLVPVLDGDRIVGIITPQNLQRSMSILSRKTQPAPPSSDD